MNSRDGPESAASCRGRVPSNRTVAILDTDVLFGTKSRIALVEAVRQRRFDGVWSPHIIGELYRNLTIRWLRKHGFDSESLSKLSRASKAMMDVLLRALSLVDTGPTENEPLISLRDIDDFHLVRAARLSGARFVVSNNTRDFPPLDAAGKHTFEGVEFITYAGFLEELGTTETQLLSEAGITG
ncbi:MAG TPA: PIN domain-containing protein [Candidatus Elarobacter sp.]